MTHEDKRISSLYAFSSCCWMIKRSMLSFHDHPSKNLNPKSQPRQPDDPPSQTRMPPFSCEEAIDTGITTWICTSLGTKFVLFELYQSRRTNLSSPASNDSVNFLRAQSRPTYMSYILYAQRHNSDSFITIESRSSTPPIVANTLNQHQQQRNNHGANQTNRT